MSNSVFQSTDGRHWEPAVPLPLYGGWLWFRWFECGCRRRFKSELEYEVHFRRDHTGVEPQ